MMVSPFTYTENMSVAGSAVTRVHCAAAGEAAAARPMAMTQLRRVARMAIRPDRPKSPDADEPQDLAPAARGQPRVVDARAEVSVRSTTPRAGLTTTTRRRGRGLAGR